MKRTLLISVAAAALLAGANVADAQKGDRGPSSPSPSMNTPAANPADTPTTANPGSPSAREHAIPEKQQTTQAPPKGTAAPQSTDAQLHRQPTPQTTGETQNNGPDPQRNATDRTQNKGDRSAERPMTSRNVSLSTEQKTTIREKVLTGSVPRVTNVNFDIRVGVVVPRTIRVAPLPDTVVDIEPSWRGYMYFVRGDEIIVVEPDTLRIVAVLEV